MFSWLLKKFKTKKNNRYDPSYLIDIETCNFKSDKHPLCPGVLVVKCDYNTSLGCVDCKFGKGKKDPRVKSNQKK